MNEVTVTKIENFLIELTGKSEIDIVGLVTIEDIDTSNPYESIYEQIDENRGFDIDVIYYSTAINYLKENDPSLHESLALAYEMGFELKNLNSETLASLLKSQNERENFVNLKSEIEQFFEDLETED